MEKWVEKNGRKKVEFWKKKFIGKTQNRWFLFYKSQIGGRTILFRCHLDMGCMGHGRKKFSKFVSKIPIFTYSTPVHLDSTSNHSKSCRGLFFLHSAQFWGQTDVICRSWKNNSKMMIFTEKIHHRPFRPINFVSKQDRLNYCEISAHKPIVARALAKT